MFQCAEDMDECTCVWSDDEKGYAAIKRVNPACPIHGEREKVAECTCVFLGYTDYECPIHGK